MEPEPHPRRAWFDRLYRGPGRLSNRLGKPAFCEPVAKPPALRELQWHVGKSTRSPVTPRQS